MAFLFALGGIIFFIVLYVNFNDKLKDKQSDIPVPPEAIIFRCPRCHSTAITANQQGFGVGKAAIATVAFGPIGLLAGGLGSKKVKITCLQCGHQWAPNSSEVKLDKEYQKTEYRMKLLSKTPSLSNLETKYLKLSVVNADIQAQTAAFSTDAKQVEHFRTLYMAELAKQHIVAVSDKEFYQITGLR